MKFFLVLLVVGFGAWWHFRTPAPAPAPKSAVMVATPIPAAPRPAAAAAPAPAAPVAAPATGASWPRRNIDRAQAAVGAVKATREGF